MGTDETQIIEYLKQFPNTFVSAIEICKRASGRKRFNGERDWARPVLRRLEVDGFLESNEYGQFKLRGLDDNGKARSVYERCRKAITDHVLQMDPSDDNKPFAALLREAIQTEYTEETSWLRKSD